MIKAGGDFSGVGAFNQALIRLGIPYKEVFVCDMDKYARQTFIHNYGEPEYYPKDVYERDVPSESLDIYMTSPPCQAFSLAGRRKGEDDKRGILFYNSHEFIKENKPRYFIFENVKGLLSDDKGNTFAKWVQYLGGKSVNGNPTLFPHEESLPYHIYWKVLNAKDYNIPQNRERVFIIGIRDDEDNDFTWPKEMFLEKRLKDVLESDVDEKYYLSDKLVSWITMHRDKRDSRNTFPMNEDDVSQCVTDRYYKTGAEDPYIKVKSDTKQGYELDEVGEDSINFEHPGSNTTICNQGVAIGAIRGRNPNNPTSRISGQPTQQMLEINQNGTSNALTTVQKDNVVVEGVKVVANLPGKHEQNSRVYGTNGLSPTLTTMQGGGQEPKIKVKSAAVQKDNAAVYTGIAVHPFSKKLEFDGFKDRECPTLLATDYKAPKCVQYSDFRIRKLTPRECFRLMDFPDSFTWPVSDSQAYKQAGNSICVGVLAKIIEKLKL